MFNRNNRDDSSLNKIFFVLCLFLLILLTGLLYWSKKSDEAQSVSLQKLAQSQEENRDFGENQEGNKQEQEKKETQDKATQEQESSNKEEQDHADNQEEQSEEDTAAKPEGIVCWGDDLINGEDSAVHSYKVHLQNLLKEEGYQLPLQDKTLQGAGTLSMMTMAGVPAEEVQAYITSHQEAAGGGELPITETGIRDLTPEQTARTDLNCIPIIFMGYYGGWNHDPTELAGQQEKILHTFPDQERFIIVGTRPMDGSVDTETFDRVMNEKWGAHYVSVAAATTYQAATYEAQPEIAGAVLEKLKELGYLEQ